MIVPIFIILFYLLTVMCAYSKIKKMYSKGGETDCSDPAIIDFIIIFIPIINLIVFYDSKFKLLNWFFQIKK